MHNITGFINMHIFLSSRNMNIFKMKLQFPVHMKISAGDLGSGDPKLSFFSRLYILPVFVNYMAVYGGYRFSYGVRPPLFLYPVNGNNSGSLRACIYMCQLIGSFLKVSCGLTSANKNSKGTSFIYFLVFLCHMRRKEGDGYLIIYIILRNIMNALSYFLRNKIQGTSHTKTEGNVIYRCYEHQACKAAIYIFTIYIKQIKIRNACHYIFMSNQNALWLFCASACIYNGS